MTKDGRPYGPIRYKQIIKECYVISKNTNTPYTALMDITPTEKNALIDLILDENRRSEEALQKARAAARKKRDGRGA